MLTGVVEAYERRIKRKEISFSDLPKKIQILIKEKKSLQK